MAPTATSLMVHARGLRKKNAQTIRLGVLNFAYLDLPGELRDYAGTRVGSAVGNGSTS